MSDRVEKIDEIEEIERIRKVTRSGRTYYYLNLSKRPRRERPDQNRSTPDDIVDIRSTSASPEGTEEVDMLQEWLDLRKTDLAHIWRKLIGRYRPQTRRTSENAEDRAPFVWPKELQAALGVLGLRTTSSAEEVRDRWRELVKRLHPDGGGTAEEFIRVHEAYEILASYAQHKASDGPRNG